MSALLFILQISLWGAGGLLTLMVGYLVILTIAACWAPKRTPLPAGEATHRFVLLVPAHNEEQLLPALLANISQLAYPRQLYTLVVVADNCTDQTAALARAAGALVYERFDRVQIGKGYALQWLLAQLHADNIKFDAAVILDADSVVSPNFLQVMAAHLAKGERAIQAHYAVLNPHRTWVMSLRAAALALIHYVRPLGRTVLGGSVGLKGNGMVFHRTLLAEHQWSASVTEDIEYHMSLVLAGERVYFAADATVWAEMPGTLQGSHTQNVRWEQGRFQLARQYVPQLLKAAIGNQAPNVPARYLLFDSIMEHLIPPFSLLTGLTVVYWVLAWLPLLAVGTWSLLFLATLLLLGQVGYILGGLILARTPVRTFLALVYTPVFVWWKIRLLLRVATRVEKQGWVRTARDSA